MMDEIHNQGFTLNS